MLARAGVPGLALWLLTLACWGTVVLTNMVRARLRGDHAWASFFLLTFCYACGFLIDASVDVTLEGPMAGIWFWCVFGVGYRRKHDLPIGAGQERSAQRPASPRGPAAELSDERVARRQPSRGFTRFLPARPDACRVSGRRSTSSPKDGRCSS